MLHQRNERLRRNRRDTAKPNGETLRRRFNQLGVTQHEFACAEKGFTLRTLQRALAGTRIAKTSLARLAEALSLSYDQIVVAPDLDRRPTERLIALSYELRLQFQRGTECRQPPLNDHDFRYVRRLIDRMRRLDSDNGHTHYYAGEMKRWMGRREESHADFFRYLDFEEAHQAELNPAQQAEAGPETCYQRAHGYCRERTAWIHHLLALDLWERGRVKRDSGLLEHALNHANAVLRHFPNGFVQHTSTIKMRDAIQLAIARLIARGEANR
jgi:transcriptional regulator with XRE-family HTH domain